MIFCWYFDLSATVELAGVIRKKVGNRIIDNFGAARDESSNAPDMSILPTKRIERRLKGYKSIRLEAKLYRIQLGIREGSQGKYDHRIWF